MAVDAEAQNRERKTERAVRLASNDTRSSRLTDGWARVSASMDVLGTCVEAIVKRLGDVTDQLRIDLTSLVRDGLRAVCKELIDLALADFTGASDDTSGAPDAESVPAGGAVLSMCVALMALEVVPSGSIPTPNKEGVTDAIEKAVTNLIGDTSLSHPSASSAVNAPSLI